MPGENSTFRQISGDSCEITEGCYCDQPTSRLLRIPVWLMTIFGGAMFLSGVVIVSTFPSLNIIHPFSIFLIFFGLLLLICGKAIIIFNRDHACCNEYTDSDRRPILASPSGAILYNGAIPVSIPPSSENYSAGNTPPPSYSEFCKGMVIPKDYSEPPPSYASVVANR